MREKARIFGSALIALLVMGVRLSPPSIAAEYVYPGDLQWIYCAEKAEDCFLYCASHMSCPAPDTMFVFIRANDPVGVSRAHFRLEADYPCCDSIQAVVPCPGVVIESGNMSDGVTISFPTFLTGHFRALALVILHDAESPPYAYSDHGFCVRDAWLERPTAETIAVPDYCTRPFYPDCYWRSLLWYHPDTVDVCIGGQTDVRIQWEQSGPGYPGPTVNVSDEKSWLSTTTLNLWDTGCLTCPWHIQTDHIYVAVPEGTPAGTLSTLTIAGTDDGFVLRAVPTIAVERESWGTVKSLFK
jgi:hypothetical protein